MDDEPEDTAEYIDWDFRPYNTVRPYNHEKGWYLQENIYVRHWQNVMTRGALFDLKDRAVMREDKWFIENESYRYPVLNIFQPYIPTVRQTRIASNFILFLGKNAGQLYLTDAETLSQKFTDYSRPDVYLMQWAWTNNDHARDFRPQVARGETTKMFPDFIPTPAHEDIQTIETMARWCGTDKGQEFLKQTNKFSLRAHKYFAPAVRRNRERAARWILD